MLYKNTKAIVRSSDDDTNFSDLINGVFAMRYISTISILNLPRLWTSNLVCFTALSKSKKEFDFVQVLLLYDPLVTPPSDH